MKEHERISSRLFDPILNEYVLGARTPNGSPTNGAPASECVKTALKRFTNWLGITEESRQGPDAAPPTASGAPYILGSDGKFHEVISIDRSGRPISTPNYNELNAGYVTAPTPGTLRSVPAYPQQQTIFVPTVRRDHPYHGPPHGMVTPNSPHANAATPQGIQQLRAELQQAEI